MFVRAVPPLVFLLLLVVLTVAASPGGTDSIGTKADAPPIISGAAASDSSTIEPRDDRVVIYYFHRSARCENCLKLEAYSEEAIRGAFSTELGKGLLEWRVVDLDNASSAHFVDDEERLLEYVTSEVTDELA